MLVRTWWTARVWRRAAIIHAFNEDGHYGATVREPHGEGDHVDDGGAGRFLKAIEANAMSL
jgi:hypothetical protein